MIAVVALVAFVLSSLMGTAMAQARLVPLATAGDMPPPPWRVAGLPRQKSPLTQFGLVDVDGRRALRIEADASYGNLVHALEPPQAASTLAWEWRADQTLAAADLRSKAGDDNALKVCVFFDLPLAQVPFVERQLLRLARSQTPEKLPAATLCYVWDGTLAAGTTLANAYTRRLRYLVLQSGPAAPGSWQRERRDLAADFLQLFGDENAQVPPIAGVAVGADADNTGGRALGHVGDLVLQ